MSLFALTYNSRDFRWKYCISLATDLVVFQYSQHQLLRFLSINEIMDRTKIGVQSLAPYLDSTPILRIIIIIIIIFFFFFFFFVFFFLNVSLKICISFAVVCSF